MHKKRHISRRPRPVLAAGLILVLVAALAAAALWLGPLLIGRSSPAAPAVQPAGRVKGLLVRAASLAPLPGQTVQQQTENLVVFAAENGFNALFVEAAVPEPTAKDGYCILYRDRTLPTLPVLTQQDTFFQKPDALRLLCAAAASRSLAVYALMPAGAATRPVLAQSMQRLPENYALAGVYETESDAVLAAPDAETPAPAVKAGALVPQTKGAPGLPLATVQAWQNPSAVFLATLQPGFAGIVLQDATCAAQFPDALSVMLSALDDTAPAPPVISYAPQTAVAVTYPKDGATVAAANCYVMGVSNPAQALTVNGALVERTGKTGAFGVLVPLQEGVNSFTFAQPDGTTAAVTINRPRKTENAGTKPPPHDATKALPAGSVIQTTGWITSLLTDPGDDSAINETVREGTLARVTQCVETLRGGKKTWAYQLASGDYVLAANTRFVPGAPPAAFTGARATATKTGETLVFTGSGQPLVYTTLTDTTLVLHVYDTQFASQFSLTGSELVQRVTVTPRETSTELVLHLTQPLQGADLTFEDNTLVLRLNRTPVRSTVPGKPLQGVTVLLDAGHGADDTGAMGVAGTNAPQEKDVNLAVTLAAKYRLEQMGATVATVRTDDTFLTLQQRNALISTVQPDFFIAVHHNSIELTADANQSFGVESYYFYDSGKALGTSLVRNITQATQRADRTTKWGYYYVTRNLTCPAVLLEVGFMVNPAEYESVTDAYNIWATADAIAMSILECTPKV